MMKELKLHLGCGNNKIKGWINIDKYRKADIKDDIIILKQFKNETISEIYISHVIEHLEPEDFIIGLKRWYKILKIGGILIIRCPNGEYYLNRYLNSSSKEKLKDIISNKEGFIRNIFGNQNKGEGHKNRNLFTLGLLNESLKYAGFKIEEYKKVSVRTLKMMNDLKTGKRDLGLIFDGIPVNDLWCKAKK